MWVTTVCAEWGSPLARLLAERSSSLPYTLASFSSAESTPDIHSGNTKLTCKRKRWGKRLGVVCWAQGSMCVCETVPFAMATEQAAHAATRAVIGAWQLQRLQRGPRAAVALAPALSVGAVGRLVT